MRSLKVRVCVEKTVRDGIVTELRAFFEEHGLVPLGGRLAVHVSELRRVEDLERAQFTITSSKTPLGDLRRLMDAAILAAADAIRDNQALLRLKDTDSA